MLQVGVKVLYYGPEGYNRKSHLKSQIQNSTRFHDCRFTLDSYRKNQPVTKVCLLPINLKRGTGDGRLTGRSRFTASRSCPPTAPNPRPANPCPSSPTLLPCPLRRAVRGSTARSREYAWACPPRAPRSQCSGRLGSQTRRRPRQCHRHRGCFRHRRRARRRRARRWHSPH